MHEVVVPQFGNQGGNFVHRLKRQLLAFQRKVDAGQVEERCRQLPLGVALAQLAHRTFQKRGCVLQVTGIALDQTQGRRAETRLHDTAALFGLGGGALGPGLAVAGVAHQPVGVRDGVGDVDADYGLVGHAGRLECVSVHLERRLVLAAVSLDVGE